jgi:hypothetical protein
MSAREALIADIAGNMPDAHRRFLVSFERGKPEWPLLGVPAAPKLPGVLWRQQNLDKLSSEKRAERALEGGVPSGLGSPPLPAAIISLVEGRLETIRRKCHRLR